MKIERRPLSSLELDPHNTRQHIDRNIEAIANSLAQFGQAEPLVVQKGSNRIIGGNGRLVAMKQLGWKECDIHVVDVDDATAVALSIALNRTSDLADWSEDDLALVLDGLDPKMRETVGFTDDEFQSMLDELGQKVDALANPPDLPDDDPTVEHMTFVLHKDQAVVVREAVRAATQQGEFGDTGNQDSNGNALARVCGQFLSCCAPKT